MQTQTDTILRNYWDKDFVESNLSTLTAQVWLSDHKIAVLLSQGSTSKMAAYTEVQTSGKSLFQQSYNEMKSLFDRLPYALNACEHVQVYLVHTKYTVVPDPFFVPEKAVSLFDAVHQREAFQEVYHYDTPFGVVLFAANSIFYNTIKSLCTGSNIKHHASALIQGLLNVEAQHSPDRLYVNVHHNFIDVVQFNKQKLTYHNTFPYEAETDIIYFILSVAEQLAIHQDKLQVVVSGQISQTSPLLQLMRKYITTVNLATRIEDWSYPASFREIQDQTYFLEQIGVLCV